MPIVASMGGNAGTQALAVAVRAIASRDLTESNAPRYVLREVMTAISNGAHVRRGARGRRRVLVPQRAAGVGDRRSRC